MNNKCSRALEGQKRSLLFFHLTLGQNVKTFKYKALKLPALCHSNFPKQCQQPHFTMTYTKSCPTSHKFVARTSTKPNGRAILALGGKQCRWYHDGQAWMHVHTSPVCVLTCHLFVSTLVTCLCLHLSPVCVYTWHLLMSTSPAGCSKASARSQVCSAFPI